MLQGHEPRKVDRGILIPESVRAACSILVLVDYKGA